MRVSLRMATRDWDYLTPLILGDVTSAHIDVAIERVTTLLPDLAADPHFAAAEISFSRYVSSQARGETSVTGIPNFIMRGFRHRCIITREESPLDALSQLRGKRIGLTGWRDSGNTWTRAVLKRDGVGIEDAYWFAGRLTADHPVTDRLDGFGRPGRIEAAPGERPMIDLLAAGELDAVCTPFMPEGFFEGTPGLRPLLRDFRRAEIDYYRDVGYVPGIHLIGIKRALLAEHPWIADELSRLVDESLRLWTAKRRKYADTTPWLIEELRRTARDLPTDWKASGLAANRTMIADFLRELQDQGILDRPLAIEDLFPAGHATPIDKTA